MTVAKKIQAGINWFQSELSKKPTHKSLFGIRRSILKDLTIPMDLTDKLESAVAAYHEHDKRAFFLEGAESSDKELFSILLLMYFLSLGKSVSFYIAPSVIEDISTSYAVVFLGADLPGLHCHRIKSYIRNNLPNGRVVIVGGESLETLEKSLDKQTIDYMSHVAVRVDLDKKRVPMPEI